MVAVITNNEVVQDVDEPKKPEELHHDFSMAPPLTESKSDDSSSILNLEEYSPKTWTEIVSYGVPTVGLAFFALAHPLLFLAGALVSILGMGGAYATGAADYVSICGRNEDSKEKDDQASLPNELTISTVVSSLSCDEVCVGSQILPEPEPEEDHNSKIPIPLEHMIVDNAQFSSLHAKDFFQIFFGDDAPFSFKDFQKQRGDLDIVYSPWGDSNQRVLTFLTPTRTPFFGPSHAMATKIQVLKLVTKKCIVMECRTSLQDIPFSDRFAVCEQWIFTSDYEKTCSLQETHCASEFLQVVRL